MHFDCLWQPWNSKTIDWIQKHSAHYTWILQFLQKVQRAFICLYQALLMQHQVLPKSLTNPSLHALFLAYKVCILKAIYRLLPGHGHSRSSTQEWRAAWHQWPWSVWQALVSQFLDRVAEEVLRLEVGRGCSSGIDCGGGPFWHRTDVIEEQVQMAWLVSKAIACKEGSAGKSSTGVSWPFNPSWDSSQECEVGNAFWFSASLAAGGGHYTSWRVDWRIHWLRWSWQPFVTMPCSAWYHWCWQAWKETQSSQHSTADRRGQGQPGTSCQMAS